MAKYSKGAQKSVERVLCMRKKEVTFVPVVQEKKVMSRKQAIAIGLSEAREKGAKVPSQKKGTAASRKTGRPAKKRGKKTTTRTRSTSRK